jgi:hypothetical protein
MTQQTRQRPLDEAIETIRVNLHFQADQLRRMDMEQSDLIAKKLDRLRASLREFVKSEQREESQNVNHR